MRGSQPFFSEENGSHSRFEIISKHVLKVCCSTVKTPKKVISAWKKCYRVLHDWGVKASWYGTRKCWRVLVPPSDSDTGRGIARHFLRKEDAEKFIAAHRKTGSVALADLSLEERHVLGLIRQAEDYSPKLLLNVWHQYQQEKQSAGRRGPRCEIL
jgi:hypothetical protein